jgi:NAD(P)-dependent dehydrogenase (short-subunit alcohol dehydrogenase family)
VSKRRFKPGGQPARIAQEDGPFRLEGETALINGGGTGLGLGIGRCMASAGARVVLAGRRASELKAAAEGIGVQAGYVVCDVTRFKEAPKVIARADALFGPVTILVNNAGMHLKKPALETTDEDFLSVLNVHVFGSHALTRAVLPGMLRRKHGSIVFICLNGVPFRYSERLRLQRCQKRLSWYGACAGCRGVALRRARQCYRARLD